MKFKEITPVLFPEDLIPIEDVEIDKHGLNTEFRIFAPIYWRYSMETSYAQERVNEAKAGLKKLKDRLYLDFKSANPKATEKHLESLIGEHESVVAQQQILAKAEYELRNLQYYLESLRYKKDMLIQLGADARKEV